MSSPLFTTDDGDIILRAGSEPNSEHDFRVHKLIISLASPVFKDMFAFPQPPDPNSAEVPDISIVDVPDSPKVLDAILRFIYPGVEPPKIPDLSTLSALLSAADKYNITSIYPVLRDILKTFLPNHPFGAYIVACRFGFLEEAKEAAKVSNSQSIRSHDLDKEVQHVSGIDVLQFARFVQAREYEGLSTIEHLLGPSSVGEGVKCKHWEDAKDFYYRLEKAVEEAFVSNPRMEHMDLFAVLDQVPDPLPGCRPLSNPAQVYHDAGNGDVFNCPLLPMSIRNNLELVAMELEEQNRRMLDEAFVKGIGSV